MSFALFLIVFVVFFSEISLVCIYLMYVYRNLLKAIGGVRVKKIMLSFFERSQYGGKDAFYGIKISYRVQKLSQFKARKFRSVSHKKDEKN